MDSLALPIIALHVVAVVIWIGGLVACAVVATSKTGDEKTRGAIARLVYRRLAAPGFGLALLLGLARLVPGWKSATVDANGIVAGGYAKAPWMHVKLTLVVVIIVLDQLVGARIRKMERDGANAGPIGMLALVALLCAIGAVIMVVVRPFQG